MPLPKSIDSYRDCEEFLDKALAKPKGMAFTLETQGQAQRLIQRMNTFRAILRKNSREVYPPESPQHGTSIYDSLKISHDSDKPGRILVQPYSTAILKEEEL
jgi:hypothetical protein